MPQFLFDFGFWQDFASNGLATLLGIIVGIPVALWVSGYQERKNERERKEKILIILLEELRYNAHILTSWQNKDDKKDVGEYLCSELRVESWKAFSDGGELAWIKDPILLNYLAQSYFALRRVSFLSEKWLGNKVAPPRSFSHSTMNLLSANLNENVDEALAILEETVEVIHEQIPRE